MISSLIIMIFIYAVPGALTYWRYSAAISGKKVPTTGHMSFDCSAMMWMIASACFETMTAIILLSAKFNPAFFNAVYDAVTLEADGAMYAMLAALVLSLVILYFKVCGSVIDRKTKKVLEKRLGRGEDPEKLLEEMKKLNLGRRSSELLAGELFEVIIVMRAEKDEEKMNSEKHD